MHRINYGERLFSPTNDFLIIFSAVSHAASLMVDGKTHNSANPSARINTTQFDYAFVLPLRGPLEHALKGTTPEYIEIGMTPNTDEILEHAKIRTTGLNAADTYGDGMNWQPTLNFCRVVRNAAAHGSINFRNLRAPSVVWRGLSFGPADNGRQIIGGELRVGDIIGPMFEANEELDRMGAPIL